MKYQPPFDEALPPVDDAQSNNADDDASYVNGDPAILRAGSIPPAAAFEEHQRELVHLIDYSGQTPSHTDLEQVRKAIQWMIEDNATQIASIGGFGQPVYEGFESGAHKFRRILAGTNVTVDLVETAPGSGDYAIRISATASGGGGGGGSPHENVGDGAQVHRTNDGTYDELRTLKGAAGGGITVTQNDTDIDFRLSSIAAWRILLRNASSSGVPGAHRVIDLADEPTPATLDKVILGKAADGALRSVTVGALRGGGGNTIPVAGSFSISTALAGHTINSSDFTGATCALKPGDPLSVRLTFPAALADTRYLVNVKTGGQTAVGVTKATTHVDLYVTSTGSVTETIEAFIVKLG